MQFRTISQGNNINNKSNLAYKDEENDSTKHAVTAVGTSLALVVSNAAMAEVPAAVTTAITGAAADVAVVGAAVIIVMVGIKVWKWIQRAL